MNNTIKIPGYKEYKFIFIETTAECNLSCSYCYYLKRKEKPVYVEKLIETLVKYDRLIICFIGGEPFLNYSYMERIMNHPKLQNKDIIYTANTNGTQFKSQSPELLKRFLFYYVSIDGYEKLNDSFRGNGSFKTVMDNVAYLRDNMDVVLIARMTISNPDQLLDIPKLFNMFDAIYWQINNTVNDLKIDFIERYLVNLAKLFDIWVHNYCIPQKCTIIPFIGMAYLILQGGMSEPYLICGSGKSHVNICIDGSVYPCPESHYRFGKKEKLGDYYDFNYRPYERKTRCDRCDILKYCGGRCAMTDNELYCKATLHLYKLVKRFIMNIDTQEMKALHSVIMQYQDICFTTEIIP